MTSELEFWKVQWEREKYDRTYGAINLLDYCDVDILPIIHVLLRILATLPRSAAYSERSFSTLRRIETWLCSTTSEERFNGLALMSIHHDIEINVKNVINRY